MPELPDVEIFKRRFEESSLGRTLQAIVVQDERLLKDIKVDAFSSRLSGRRFEEVNRHGKYCFAAVSGEAGWLVLHFGMSGFLVHVQAETEAPREAMVSFAMPGGALIYASTRKLGFLSLIPDREAFIAEQDLGPDPMVMSREAFFERIKNRKGRLKTALMNQSVLAGIGNIYADEILFQSGLHPTLRINDLSREQLETVYETMLTVLWTAVDSGADPEHLPKNFLIPHRSEKDRCPVCGGAVSRLSISGRSAYFCPECQPKPSS